MWNYLLRDLQWQTYDFRLAYIEWQKILKTHKNIAGVAIIL